MRIHFVMHASFEKLGAIETWAVKNGHQLTGTHIYRGEKLPSPAAFDFLIFMGGPQSPLELDKYPYLTQEIELARSAIKENKRVFGVCLGAQIIAEALGATTQRSPHKEIGMYPIELLPEGVDDPVFSHFPQKFDVMHWHNDMPGIAKGAVLLARSEGCPQQAFRYGNRVYGFQFHVEPTRELIEGMIANCGRDLKPGAYVRSEAELLSSDFDAINNKLYVFLDYMTSLPEVNK